MTESRTPVFVAALPAGSIGMALSNDFDQAVALLGRLVSVMPPVEEAYVVPNSTVREAK